jgi:hypothetical protein
MPVSPTPSAQPPSWQRPEEKLKLSSPAQILAAIPYLIGFAPERSIVVISLRRKRIGLTMRFDLATPRVEAREIVVSRLRADRATEAVLVLYDPPAARPQRPGAPTARGMIRAIRRSGIHVQDALGVREGRYWSYLCTDLSCCPELGRAVPCGDDADFSRVAATFVALGTAPLASRDQLRESLTLSPAVDRAQLEDCYQAASRSPSLHPVARWLTAVERYAAGPVRPGGELSLQEAAHLIVSLQDNLVRDEIVSWCADELIDGLLTVCRELVRLAVPPYHVQLLATLAWAAFVTGDGALASVALELALAAEPGHALSGLLAQALDGGITPEQMQRISRALGDLPWSADAR